MGRPISSLWSIYNLARNLAFSFLLLLASVEAFAASGITYQGRLLKPNGDPVTSMVEFKLQIRTPGSEDCLLYEETISENLSTTSGMFSLSLGKVPGNRTDSYSANWSLFESLQNRKNFTGFAGADCTGVTFYNPSATDNRVFKVSFNDGTQAPGTYEELPAQEINFVPMAAESLAVGGFTSKSLLRVEDTGVLGNISPLSNAQYAELLLLLSGNSGQYTKDGELSGHVLPSLSNNESIRWNSGAWQAFTPLASESDPTVRSFAKAVLPTCPGGQVLTGDGTSLSCVPDTGGWSAVDATDTVKGIVVVPSGSGLAVVGGSLSLENVGTAGTYFKVTTDAKGRVTTGAASLLEADIPTLTTAGKVSGGAINSGTIGGTTSINTSGAITTTGAVSAGSVTSTGNISVTGVGGKVSSTISEMRRIHLMDDDAGPTPNRIEIKTPTDITSDYTMTLPGTQGTANQVLGMNNAGSGMEYKSITQGSGVTITHSAGGIQIAATGSGGTLTGVGGTSPISIDNTNPLVPVVSLDNSGATAGSYGSGTQVPTFTVDAKGRITTISNTAISGTSPVGAALAQANIWVGSSGGVAAAVSMSGDVTLTDAGLSTVVGIRSNAVQTGTPSEGQVYRYDASGSPMFKASHLTVSDIRSAANMGISVFPSSCTDAQTMTWSSLSDTFVCSNISIAHTQVSGLTAANIANTPAGTIAATTVQAAINELDGDVGGKVSKIGDTMTGTLVVPSIVRTPSGLPGSPAVGEIAIDSGDSNKLKWYTGSGWEVASSASGTINSITGTVNEVTVDNSVPTAPVISLGNLAVSPAGSYGSATQVATVTVDAKGRVTAAASTTITGVPAANITNTPAGTIAASDVQAALNELGTEKVAKAGDTMTGALTAPSFIRVPSGLPGSPAVGEIAIDSGDSNKLKWYNGSSWQVASTTSGTVTSVVGTANQIAVDSSTPSAPVVSIADLAVSPAGTYGTTAAKKVSVTVDAKGRVTAASEADITGVPAANITNTPAGTIAATDIQAAINELDGDVGGKVSKIGDTMTGLLIVPELRRTPSGLPGTPVAGDIAIDSGDSNKLKWYTGSGWEVASSASGTINSITGTANEITVNNSVPTAPVVSLGNLAVDPSGTFGSTTQIPKIVVDAKGRVTAVTLETVAASPVGQALNSGQMWVGSVGNVAAAVSMSGDGELSNAGALKVVGIQNFPVASTTPTDGQVYRYHGVGNEFRPQHLTVSDIRSAANMGISVFPSACTDAQTMTWSSLTDTFLCNNISIAHTQVSGLIAANIANTPAGTIAATDVQAAINELDGDVGGKVSKIGDTMTGLLVVPELRRTPSSLPGSPVAGEIAIDSGDSNKLKWYTGSAWEAASTSSGVTDHGALSGLSDDDHTQYAMLAGRVGGQSLIGGTAANNNLTLESTSNGTKGYVNLQPNGGFVGIGTISPNYPIHVFGDNSSTTGMFRTGGGYNQIKVSAGSTTLVNFAGTSEVIVGSETNHPLLLQTNNTEKMRIDSSGNVGIGTDNPNQLLTVEGPMSLRTQTAPTATTNYGKLYVDSGDANKLKYMNPSGGITNLSASGVPGGSTAEVQFNNAGAFGGSPKLYWNFNTDDLIVGGPIPFGPANGSSIWVNSSGNDDGLRIMNATTGATATDGSDFVLNGSDLMITNRENANIRLSTNGGERLRIDSSGNVGIGTNNPGRLLHVHGYMRMTPQGSAPGTPGAGDMYVDSTDSNKLKIYNGSTWDSAGGGVSAHGSLTGLGNDDHTQYAMLAGRVGGQSLIGGTAANNNLTLESTSNGTKGYINLQPNGGLVGIGTTAPSNSLHVSRNQNSTTAISVTNTNTASGVRTATYMEAGGQTIEIGAMGPNTAFGNVAAGESYITTSGTLTFWTNAAAPMRFVTNNTEGLRISGTGNVGVGTNNPGRLLHVHGYMRMTPQGSAPGTPAAGDMYVDSTDSNKLKIYNGSTWDSAGGGVSAHGSLTGLGNDDHTQYAMLAGRVGGQTFYGGTGNSNNLALESTSGGTKGHVLLQSTGGNVGVGTTSPSSKLHVVGGNLYVGPAPTYASLFSIKSVSPFLTIEDSDSTGNDTTGGISFRDSAGNTWASISDSNVLNQDLIVQVSNGGLKLRTDSAQPVILGTSGLEKMRIDSSGNVGIGTDNPGRLLHVHGYMRMTPQGSAPGTPAAGDMYVDSTDSNKLKIYNGSTWDSAGGGASAHGSLTGLTNDDHTQYTLLAGRTGGQTLVGGIANSDSLTLNSTSAGTKGYVNFQTTGGNVGIGTTTPIPEGGNTATEQKWLHIVDGSNDHGGLRLGNGTGGGAFVTGVASRALFAQNMAIDRYNNIKGVVNGAGYAGVEATNGVLNFYTNNTGASWSNITPTARITINNSGYVGINTATPGTTYRLNVNGDVYASGAYYVPQYGGIGVGGTGNAITFLNSWTQLDKPLAGSQNYAAVITSATGTAGAPAFAFNNDEDNGMFRPNTNMVGFSTAGTERVRINASGDVGIGTTTISEKLTVNGNIQATAFLYSSDERLKKDIKPIENPLEKLTQLRGVTYNWRNPSSIEADHPQIGVIAQEVQKQFPEAVAKSKDGVLRVNYPALIAPVIEAIRDLYAKYMDQSQEIESLKDRVERLEKVLCEKDPAICAKDNG